jgi:tetratricopeptide (TPR) repeat protein
MSQARWLLAAMIAAVGAVSSVGEEQQNDAFRDGRAAFDRGDFAAAVDRLTEALVRSPGDKRVQGLLLVAGQKLVEREDLKKIPADDLRQIVQQAEMVLDTRQRDIRRALQELKIAQHASQKRTPQETLRACRGVDLVLHVTLGDDAESQRFREYLHSVCANLETAVHSGMLMSPADESRVLGYVAFCHSRWGEAAALWERALVSQPNDDPLRHLAVTARAREQEERSAARTEKCIADVNTAVKENRDEAAVILLKQALIESPGNERLVTLLEEIEERVTLQRRQRLILFHRTSALKARKDGRWLDAARGWLAVLREDPLDAQAQEELDSIRRQWGKQIDPNVGSTHSSVSQERVDASEKRYTLGLIRYADGDLDAAVGHFRACLAENPAHEYARKALERVEEERKPVP